MLSSRSPEVRDREHPHRGPGDSFGQPAGAPATETLADQVRLVNVEAGAEQQLEEAGEIVPGNPVDRGSNETAGAAREQHQHAIVRMYSREKCAEVVSGSLRAQPGTGWSPDSPSTTKVSLGPMISSAAEVMARAALPRPVRKVGCP
jgi:hypothetical protein